MAVSEERIARAAGLISGLAFTPSKRHPEACMAKAAEVLAADDSWVKEQAFAAIAKVQDEHGRDVMPAALAAGQVEVEFCRLLGEIR